MEEGLSCDVAEAGQSCIDEDYLVEYARLTRSAEIPEWNIFPTCNPVTSLPTYPLIMTLDLHNTQNYLTWRFRQADLRLVLS